MRPTRRTVLLGGGIGLASALAGCLGTNTTSETSHETDPTTNERDWTEMELLDVRNDQPFRIADYSDRNVLVDSFAVWCPECANQQLEFQKIREMMPETVATVSLNTDPNEQGTIVRNHLIRHGFDWPFAVAPPEMTSALIERFGRTVASPPSTPVVLICIDGNQRFIESEPYRPKTAKRLQREIRNGC